MSLVIKKKIRTERVDVLYKQIAQWEQEGVEIFKINEYQYRIIRADHAIDFYPTSGKYYDTRKNKWGYTSVVNIIYLLFDREPHK